MPKTEVAYPVGLQPPEYLKDPTKVTIWMDDTTALLHWIVEYHKSWGVVPTFREIASWAKLRNYPLTSLCVIHRRLDYLEEAGYIVRVGQGSNRWSYTGKAEQWAPPEA
jgi:SOS-response transcriptional repressor LexA